ncbi:flocculation protein FLO11 [Toxotes jaculatrix]|uniref:flocculation protein FLO11 n=1 Tax=Toxotes jaculatrix TaxID=941984 RepID=UPI001B3AC962|nr:flocculation protein FLO11 [Toxotes jaculatrix]
MSPLFMDTGYEPNSPGSLSAEESNSNTAGSEREGDGPQTEHTGTKRRERNRDAARRTRRKQTERADELHEELQRLEQSNSALQKEITVLKKELQRYTTTLSRHEPYCCLRASGSSSSSATRLSVSHPTEGQTTSSPPRVAPQASSSTLAAAPSISTSLTSSLGLKTLDCVENTHLPASAPTATLASSSGSSAELISASSSSPVTVPCSVLFSTHAAPHSLFSESRYNPITSRPTNVMPICTSPISTPVPSSGVTTVAQPQSGQDNIHETSPVSANASFSALHSGTVDVFLMRQTSFASVSSNVVPPYSHLTGENEGLVAQGCPMRVPQLHADHYSGRSSLMCTILPSALQDPAPQNLRDSPQTNLEPSPAPTFALKPSYGHRVTPKPSSLLSLLTVPSPLNTSQTTSTSSDGLIGQHPPSLPLLGDPSSDLSLSELLEGNDWILSGTSNQ